MNVTAVVKVWCLPVVSEERLRQIHRAIVRVAVGMRASNLKSEKDLIVLFPPDSMRYGLGMEIVIETAITNFTEDTTQNHFRRRDLAEKLGLAVRRFFRGSKIESFVYPIDWPVGHWTSSPQTQIRIPLKDRRNKPPRGVLRRNARRSPMRVRRRAA